MISLLEEIELKFYRPEGKEFFVNGRPVKSPVKPFNLWGSIHPYKEGNRSRTLPEGKTSRDAKIFRVLSNGSIDLRAVDPFKKFEADFTEYQESIYYVFDVEDWTTQQLTNSHYKVILVRKDEMVGTE